jgi:HEAT repeat protein
MLMLLLTTGAAARSEIRTDFAMDSDPMLIAPEPVILYPVKHRAIWLKALTRPEADMQRQAAEAIAEAHRLGTPDLGEAKPALVQILTAESTHSAARLAAARALVALAARESADKLFDASQKYGSDMRQAVEPAFAAWKYQPIQKVWQQRLEDSESRHRDLMLAIQGISILSETSSIPALLAIVHDPLRPSSVRLAAARAAGQIQSSGLGGDAEKLLGSPTPSKVNRLCAASLLKQHRSQSDQSLLLRLAQDEEPTIAAAALTTLNATEPQSILPLVERVIVSRDPNVRLQGIAAAVKFPTPERVSRLAPLLDDPHPSVRGDVRERLFVLAKQSDLQAPILQAATEVLAADSWRGQEQAALLLAALDHKPAAARMVELMNSPREEVVVATAWGLRKLAVPSTLPAILEKVQNEFEIRSKFGTKSRALDAQGAMLCETLGLMKYAPADAVLRKYIPKNLVLGELTRSGAIWALGHLHAGKPDEPLARLMTERLTEPASAIPMEMFRVRHACAISLGRMQAKSQVEPMRKFPHVGLDVTSMAIRWSIHELTGESLPEPERPVVAVKAKWFLEALD